MGRFDWSDEDARLFHEQEQAALRDPAVHVIRDAPSRWVGVPWQARFFFLTLCCYTTSVDRAPERGKPAIAAWTCYPGIARLVMATGASKNFVRAARDAARKWDLVSWDPTGWREASTLYTVNWRVAARLAVEGKAEQDRLLAEAAAAERARVAERRHCARRANAVDFAGSDECASHSTVGPVPPSEGPLSLPQRDGNHQGEPPKVRSTFPPSKEVVTREAFARSAPSIFGDPITVGDCAARTMGADGRAAGDAALGPRLRVVGSAPC